MPRTDPSTWGTLFNFLGDGFVHMETFGTDVLQHKKVTLAHADILALPTTPFLVLPAPGLGYSNIPLAVVVQNKLPGGAYGNIASFASIGLQWYHAAIPGWTVATGVLANEAWWAGDFVTLMLTTDDQVATLLPATYRGDPYSQWAWGVLPYNLYDPTGEQKTNLPLYLVAMNDGQGDYTGGSASNQLQIDLYFVTITAP